jgi:hypothetical protein
MKEIDNLKAKSYATVVWTDKQITSEDLDKLNSLRYVKLA